MTTALFMLRCLELGLHVADLDLLTIGMVYDIMTERGNDSAEDAWHELADQDDFDRF